MPIVFISKVQWKPLNVITLVRSQSDNINRMITIAEHNILREFAKQEKNGRLQPPPAAFHMVCEMYVQTQNYNLTHFSVLKHILLDEY